MFAGSSLVGPSFLSESMDPHSKRQRVLPAVAAAQPATSLADVGRILEAAGVVDDTIKVYREVDRHLSGIDTPYGKVLSHIDLPCYDGSTYRWVIANPFALIHFLTITCAAYARC